MSHLFVLVLFAIPVLSAHSLCHLSSLMMALGLMRSKLLRSVVMLLLLR